MEGTNTNHEYIPGDHVTDRDGQTWVIQRRLIDVDSPVDTTEGDTEVTTPPEKHRRKYEITGQTGLSESLHKVVSEFSIDRWTRHPNDTNTNTDAMATAVAHTLEAIAKTYTRPRLQLSLSDGRTLTGKVTDTNSKRNGSDMASVNLYIRFDRTVVVEIDGEDEGMSQTGHISVETNESSECDVAVIYLSNATRGVSHSKVGEVVAVNRLNDMKPATYDDIIRMLDGLNARRDDSAVRLAGGSDTTHYRLADGTDIQVGVQSNDKMYLVVALGWRGAGYCVADHDVQDALRVIFDNTADLIEDDAND